jgi:hypothetical protein
MRNMQRWGVGEGKNPQWGGLVDELTQTLSAQLFPADATLRNPRLVELGRPPACGNSQYVQPFNHNLPPIANWVQADGCP